MSEVQYVTKDEFKELINIVRDGFSVVNKRFDHIETRLSEQDEYYGKRDEEFRLTFTGIETDLERIWQKLDEIG